MSLNLPHASVCFVDSNIFYYALVPTLGASEQCISLLDRAVDGQLSLYTSISVLSDTIHKVMVSEAAQLTGRDRAGMVGYLGKHPDLIPKLKEYQRALHLLGEVPMTILPVDIEALHAATRIAGEYCLLTNDALIVSIMRHRGIIHLISNDDDFDHVPGLSVWKPR